MAFWRSLAGAALCLSLTALAADPSAPSKINRPEAKLEVWVGHWKTTGESGGKRWSADTVCHWSVNHGFVVCDQLINEQVNQLMILAYDAESHGYRIASIGQDREPFVSRGAVDGSVWTNTAEFEQDGKKILMRTIVDFSHAGHYADVESISEDGGAHWTETSKGHSTKVE